MANPMHSTSANLKATDTANEVGIWMGQVLRRFPSTSRLRVEHVLDEQWAKIALTLNMPLTESIPDSLADIPAPFVVQHLNLNVDVSNVVSFRDEGEQTICSLPHGQFAVKVGGPHIETSLQQHDAIFGAFKSSFFNALHILKLFPGLTEVDIDVCGHLPRQYYLLQHAVSCNNECIYFHIRDNFPNIRAISIQTGRNLDYFQYGDVTTRRNAPPKRDWDLKASYMCSELLLVSDFYDLTQVRDHLRSDRRVALDLTGGGPSNGGRTTTTVYKKKKQTGLAKMAGELDIEHGDKSEAKAERIDLST